MAHASGWLLPVKTTKAWARRSSQLCVWIWVTVRRPWRGNRRAVSVPGDSLNDGGARLPEGVHRRLDLVAPGESLVRSTYEEPQRCDSVSSPLDLQLEHDPARACPTLRESPT